MITQAHTNINTQCVGMLHNTVVRHPHPHSNCHLLYQLSMPTLQQEKLGGRGLGTRSGQS